MTLPDLTWRRPTRDDLGAWARCVTDTEAVDRTGEIETEEMLSTCFDGIAHDPNDAWFGFLDSGEIGAWTWPFCFGASHREIRVTLDGAVRPALRGRGLGSALLPIAEHHGTTIIARRASSADIPAWLEVQAYEHHDDRTALFDALGYRPLRYFDERRRDLSAPIDAPVVIDGLHVTRFDFAFDDAVLHAHNEAFADHWGSSPWSEREWKTYGTGAPDFRSDLSFVALAGGAVAGYAINAVHEHEWEALGHREGWIEELGVRRPWRGRGVATSLLNASMRAFADAELHFAALGVDAASPTGADRLYARVGFERVQGWTIFAKSVPDRAGPDFPPTFA